MLSNTGKSEEPLSLHSAITSWGGFIYQGKVSLYHALRKLFENIQYDYYLQLDSLDDFAILNSSREPISMHQVKALKSSYYSSYSEAFKALNKKNKDCSKLYFHTAVNITNMAVEDIEKNHSNIKVYKYENDEPNCKVGDIDKKIESMCMQIYKKHNPSNDTFKDRDDYCSKTREYLDQIIIKKVISIHQKTHDDVARVGTLAYKETILFSEFKAVLDDNLIEKDIPPDYYLYLSILDFHRYYQDFCIENEDELDESTLKKLSLYLSKIEVFDSSAMTKFIKSIIPHREFKFNTMTDYKDNNLVKDEVKDAFFRILSDLGEGEINNSNNIMWKCKEGKNYNPTTINAGNKSRPKVCGRIIENSKDNDLDVIFEGNNLVTLEMSSESIYEDAKIGKDIENENVVKCKKVKLISLDDTKRKINGK